MLTFPTVLSRRKILFGGSSALILTACSGGAADSNPTLQPDIGSNPDGTDWAALTEEEWRDRLSPAAFRVLRKEDTERPFTSPLNEEKRDGIYHCAGCDLALFSSEQKYDSGTGWPSFWAHLDGVMGTKADNKFFMQRTEYHCIRCGGHQGHVFNDGPAPTGERWCNNGVALTFRPTTA
ncbi:MAG: peptide-methionine (R)-S-oxide reductase [Ponticaulis sp.]|nr:peptide-methionine (R)-S-oxide reductase [Ponticaulis sp.]